MYGIAKREKPMFAFPLTSWRDTEVRNIPLWYQKANSDEGGGGGGDKYVEIPEAEKGPTQIEFSPFFNSNLISLLCMRQ